MRRQEQLSVVINAYSVKAVHGSLVPVVLDALCSYVRGLTCVSNITCKGKNFA